MASSDLTVRCVSKDNNLECPICLSLLNNPHLTDCCGHHFCHLCILRVKESSLPCPVCRSKSFNVFPNLEKKREVSSVEVYCSNVSNGCNWRGPFSQLETHLQQDCEYARAVPCPYKCGAMLHSQEMAEHESICPCKPIDDTTVIKQLKHEYAQLVSHVSDMRNTIMLLTEQNKELKKELNILKDTQIRTFDKVFQTNAEIQFQLEEGRGKTDVINRSHDRLKNEIEEMRSQHEKSIKQLTSHMSNNKDLIQKLESHVGHVTVTSSLTPPIVLVMNDFNRHKMTNQWWQSKPFYSHPCGYKFRLEVKASGNGSGSGTHVSAYIHVMKGEHDDELKWPLSADVHFCLIDHLNSRHHDTKVTFAPDNDASLRVPEERLAGIGRGFSQFVPLEALVAQTECQYLKNDTLTFEIMKILRYDNKDT